MSAAVVAGAAMCLVGYVIGSVHPAEKARNWARWYLHGFDQDKGRLRRLRMGVVALLLPETFVRVTWHRVRHGEWPHPKAQRTARMPKLIVKDVDQ